MDPALQELIGSGDGDELLEAIIKLDSPSRPPPGVQLVARFGDVCTCRVRRRDVQAIHADPAVLAFKAPRLLASIDREARQLSGLNIEQRPGDIRRPPDIQQTGKGVYLCVLDWGADFALDSLIDAAGNTRFKAIWNQAAKGQGAPTSPYGYGRVYDRDDINAALRFRDPYEALGYHPADGDPTGRGAHGTHVLDIAGGNGRGGGPLGMAPESELIFVHLASARLGGLADLGDSVRLLEGLDFVRRMAGDKPWCVNMSLGRHGGAHTGRSLVEQAMDNLLAEAPGRAIAQSCGNYYKARAHASGYVAPGKIREFVWQTDKADKTANELEIFYSGSDHFRVTITPPTGGEPFSAPLGGNVDITSRGTVVGRLYHRAKDSVTGDHHVDIFLFRGAPAGDWTVSLLGEKIVDGRYSAWIERDATCGGCQSRFLPEDAARETTLGSICNGFHTVVTGAYDAHDVAGNLASVSSAGPTRDGRQKPDIVAPGRRVLAARSTPRGSRPTNDFFRLTGTSMASPHVAGTLALMFEAAPRPLTIHETRRQLIGSARQPVNMSEDEAHRFGAGYLDVTAAVNAAADLDSISGTTIEITSIMAQTDSGGELESVPMPQEEKIMTYEQTDILDDLMPPITKRPPSINPDPRRIPNLVERLLRLIPSSYLREFHIDETNLPAHIFDAYTTRSGHPLRPLLDQVFEVEAGPGEQVPGTLSAGDILIERAFGEGHLAHAAVIADSRAYAAGTGPGLLPTDTYERGIYVDVAEGGSATPNWRNRSLRRIAGESARLPRASLILKPLPGAEAMLKSAVGLRVKSFEGESDSAQPERAIRLFSGSVVAPGGYPNTIEGFQDYLSASGVLHFSANEMTRPNHPNIAARYGFKHFLPKYEWWPRGAALALASDRIRDIVNEPVSMRNWWRPRAYNKAVKGAGNSDHITAHGVDLDYSSSESRRKAEAWLWDIKNNNPWLGVSLGLGNKTTHVGLLSAKGARHWYYKSYPKSDRRGRSTAKAAVSGSLKGSVGKGGKNRQKDVKFVKNRMAALGFDWLGSSGLVDRQTIEAIKLFQSIKSGRQSVGGDGRIDVGGDTLRWLEASNAPRWQKMPPGSPGQGFHNTEVVDQPWDNHDFGTNWLAQTIEAAGAAYRDDYLGSHSDAALLTVNDVSLAHGGDTDDHTGHETGLDCDMRLPRTDGSAPAATTFRHEKYDQNAMRAMLTAIKAQPLVTRVYFNDDVLIAEGLCTKLKKHDNHVHFGISPPARGAAPLVTSGPVMAVPETPTVLGSIPLFRNGRVVKTYHFTRQDLEWTARLIVGEAGGRDTPEDRAVIQSVINRYAILFHRRFPSFTKFIRTFSTTLQPVLLNWRAAKAHAGKSTFVATGGVYSKNPLVLRGQLQRHLDLQSRAWNNLSGTARSLATRALSGNMPNPGIGNADNFASTRIWFKRKFGHWPDEVEWRDYTLKIARRKKAIWVGDVSNLNQMKNAFFLSAQAQKLPPNAVVVSRP